MRTRIHLVHVLPREAARDPKAHALANRRLAREADLISKTVAACGTSRIVINSRMLIGEPHVELIRYARDADADLIVLGCKGIGARVGKVLGTTAARVVRMAETPVLVVRKPSRAAYRRPLIALPLDPSARRLTELTRSVAAHDIGRMFAVRAYHVPFAGFNTPGTEAEPTEYHKAFRTEAASALRSQLDALAKRGARLRATLRCGDALSVILTEATHVRADLIAVGTHARSGLAHILIGSVAESVVASAATDVLIARPVRFTFELP